jgi:hypothetical protein
VFQSFVSPGPWYGFVPPQRIYAKRAFKRVVLDPPDFEPGSWIGAGKAIYDPDGAQFLLTARPRRAAGNVRGYAANVYRSADGEHFDLVTSLTKEWVSDVAGLPIHSIEGTQLLRDPLTGRWHLYLSVDAGESFIWGGLYWQTLLLTADELTGPWEAQGLVLRNDHSYDAYQARDATIDIVDGVWYCIYKAMDAERWKRPGLATSVDGIHWEKHGPLTIEGQDSFAFLSGTLFAGSGGPLFVGVERLGDDRAPREVVYADEHRIGHGTGPAPSFVAYQLDVRGLNLMPVFRTRWLAASSYEREDQPLLGYASLVYDPLRRRLLIYVEAIDPELTRQMGLNETVERLILYETPL